VYGMLRFNCAEAVRQFIWKRSLKSKLFSLFWKKSYIRILMLFFFYKIMLFMRIFALFLGFIKQEHFLWAKNMQENMK